MAIVEKDRRPRSDNPRMRIVRFSKRSLEFVGLDVALEALRESIRSRKATIADLWQAAKVCRVANVMRPYMEALT
jgi:hypothetical protein